MNILHLYIHDERVDCPECQNPPTFSLASEVGGSIKAWVCPGSFQYLEIILSRSLTQ